MGKPSVLDRIDELLYELPDPYLVAVQDGARFVAGANGLFILSPATPDMASAGERLHALTEATRRALCDHLTWVPFLDAIAVTRRHTPRHRAATAVPIDMLGDVLLEGRAVVDTGTLNVVRTSVREHRLAGWSPGPVAPGAKIDLCDPAPQTSRL